MLLQKKKKELERMIAAKQEEQVRREEELRRDAILRQILTNEARERLARIKLARPNFGILIENQLISLALSGRIKEKITDAQLKEILKQYLRHFTRGGRVEIRRK